MPQHESNAVLLREMLEPCALRGASTVLRGGRCRDTPSLPDPQSGFSLTQDNRVCLSKIGTIKVKFPQKKKANPPQGTMKTCTVKREGPHWFVIFACEVEQELVYHPSEESVGIDLGLLHFGTLSDSRVVLVNPQ